MSESVREIHGHVNKQLTNHSSATEREIVKELKWFLCRSLVARLIQLGNSRRDVRQAGNFVEQQSCSTLLRV